MMSKNDFSPEMLAENRRRLDSLAAERRAAAVEPLRGADEWQRLADDFQYWALRCVKIKDKLTGRLTEFRLNRPQRRVLGLLEEQRRAGRPIRMIMLKARQWGGSTLVQMYMAWIQMVHATNWNSLICAHVKDTASTIRGMFSTMLENYPAELTEPDAEGRRQPLKFAPYEGARNLRAIPGRGCRVAICSSENPEAVRGGDYAMAHLSEVVFWADTPQRTPQSLVRAICGAIARAPLTMIVMESTANGPDNFFHQEWKRATSAEGSDKIPVFVPWHEIDIYSEELTEPAQELWARLDDYERAFWHKGLTLEQICWYHHKRREYTTHRQMMAEFPSTPDEAFANSLTPVFAPERVDALAAGVRPPALTGDVHGPQPSGPGALRSVRFEESPAGCLQVWQQPCAPEQLQMRPQYVAVVDVGGTSAGSDWSVVAVARAHPSGRWEIVAQWRGHIDHDLLAWKAAQIARWYHNALLVVESNTLESRGEYVLDSLARHYSRLYVRTSMNSVTGALETRYGFHTNVASKTAALADLNAALRRCDYDERSAEAIREYATFVRRADGSTGASPGCHDDILITRAILARVLAIDPPRPLSLPYSATDLPLS